MLRYLGIFILIIGLMTVAMRASIDDEHLTLHGHTVALDPGHFETVHDTGAVNTVASGSLTERDVNWEVVHATAMKLEALGADVLILRNADEYVGRPVRYMRANLFGAEVLVSVHHNGSADPAINYTATFYTQSDDKPIAVLAYESLRAALGTRGGDVWHDTFGMTAKPRMPSTLTEAWFITNDQMAERYLHEAQTRSRGMAVGEGWVPGTLVWLESQALTDAVVGFLKPAISRDSRHD